MILEHLSILKDHIRNYSVQTFEQIGSNLKIYLTIRFKDNSELLAKADFNNLTAKTFF